MIAYFYTKADAEKAYDRLTLFFKVSNPEPADDPVNGRPWRLTVEMLPGLSLSPDKFPNTEVESRVLAVVRQYNGVIVSST